MEKAKQAVSDLLHKSGKHDTTVQERVAPAVEHTSVQPTRHENVQPVVDKELHQDHYHTSVQPVKDSEVLPEKHSHQIAGAEHRSFEHGNAQDDEKRLATEASQFRDERVVGDTKHTHSINPAVAGEHVHHHVHETIQPVVQKSVVEPNVVHTTVPIHEVHHNAAQHHSTSALPAVSMSDFKKHGGVLSGREERTDAFPGEPKSVGGALSNVTGSTGSGTTGTHGLSSGTTGTTGTTGTHGLSSGTTGTTTSSTTGSSGLASGTAGAHGLSQETHNKPSLVDKLNPKVDADGDGKAGFMK